MSFNYCLSGELIEKRFMDVDGINRLQLDIN